VETARAHVASLIGARPEEIVFTSGGTEADNAAIEGVAFGNRRKGNHIITTAIEHDAVLECCRFLEGQGFNVTFLPVDKTGLVEPEAVKKAITPKTILISVMHANNEVGTVQPIAEIGGIARGSGVYFHTDAVQTAGHIPVNVGELNVDLLAISAHKLHGPKGVGALYMRPGTVMTPFMHGGSQEKGRRASTENVAGIAGFGRAAEMARASLASEQERHTLMRDGFNRAALSAIPGARLNGHPEKRLPNNINLSIEGVTGEALVLNLDLAGICASTGSACSSASHQASHVLRAIGLTPEQAHGSLRLSLGKWTTGQELDVALEALKRIVSNLRAEPIAPPRTEKAAAGARPGRFKGDGIVVFPDVSASIKGAGVLKAAGVENKLVAPPPKMRMGCDLALEVYLAEKPQIEKLFTEKEVAFSGILPLD